MLSSTHGGAKSLQRTLSQTLTSATAVHIRGTSIAVSGVPLNLCHCKYSQNWHIVLMSLLRLCLTIVYSDSPS